MISNDGGYSSYVNEASQINNNIANFRNRASSVVNENKSLAQGFQSKADLDSLRNFAGELGAKGVKEIGSKILGRLYDVKIGGKSLRARDIEGSFKSDGTLEDSVRQIGKRVGQGVSNKAEQFTDFLDKQKALNDERRTMGQADDFVKGRTGGGVEDAIGRGGNKSVFDSVDLDDEPSSVSRRSVNPDAEPSKPTPNEAENESIGIKREPQEVEMSDMSAKPNAVGDRASGAVEEGENSVKSAINNVAGGADDVVNASAKGAGSITEAGSDAVKAGTDVAKEAGTDLVEKGAESAGLEGAGAVLDATGVGAIVGVPLQIAGAILDGGLIYEAGKSVVDWFEEDILGHKPQIPKNQLVQAPTRPLTLADKGLAIVPNVDTLDTQVSYSGGW